MSTTCVIALQFQRAEDGTERAILEFPDDSNEQPACVIALLSPALAAVPGISLEWQNLIIKAFEASLGEQCVVLDSDRN